MRLNPNEARRIILEMLRALVKNLTKTTVLMGHFINILEYVNSRSRSSISGFRRIIADFTIMLNVVRGMQFFTAKFLENYAGRGISVEAVKNGVCEGEVEALRILGSKRRDMFIALENNLENGMPPDTRIILLKTALEHIVKAKNIIQNFNSDGEMRLINETLKEIVFAILSKISEYDREEYEKVVNEINIF